MTIDISSVQTFTDSELLILYRSALSALAVSKSYTAGGMTFTRENLADIRETIGWLEARISASGSGSGAQIGIAEFTSPN